jgi:DNA-binding transcriptional ArsR family regulator
LISIVGGWKIECFSEGAVIVRNGGFSGRRFPLGLLGRLPANTRMARKRGVHFNMRIFEYTKLMTDSLRRFKAEVFQALAHPTRIAIVELLRDGPLPAGKLIEQLGIEQANASQHLAVLRSKQIVLNRKEGNQVFYSLRHPILTEVLDLMRRYFQAHIRGTLAEMGAIKKAEVSVR